MTLSDGAERIRLVPNAGGNSVVSEVLSFEMFHRCFGAQLLKTEMEVNYWPRGGAITDYMCHLYGNRVGVSVTRAMKYRGDYSEDDARRLLQKKLKGVLLSNSTSCERWTKQILHVWADSRKARDALTLVYKNDLSDEVKANTLLVITTTSKTESDFIYDNVQNDNSRYRRVGG